MKRMLFALALLSLLPFGPGPGTLAQVRRPQGMKKPAKKKPDPRVKEGLKKIKEYLRKRGKQDAAAAEEIQKVVQLALQSADSDKKAVAKELERILLHTRRKLTQVTLYTAAIEGLKALGPFGAKGLLAAIKSKNFRKKERLQLKCDMIRALGSTREISAVKPLIDLMERDKDIQVNAAAVQALGNYAKAPEKIRKLIVERVVRIFSGTDDSSRSLDPNDPLADFYRRKLAAIGGPCQDTLRALTGQSLPNSLAWVKWWNHNKGKRWDKKKTRRRR